MKKLMSIPDSYTLVGEYNIYEKNAAYIHKARFADSVVRWNHLIDKFEVFASV